MKRKQKLPKSVKIGGRTYDIVYDDKPMFHVGHVVNGLYQPVEEKITIADDMKRNLMAEVLIHEIFHGIYDQYNVNQFVGANNNGMEELVVSAFGRGMVQIFHDNPEFVKFFTEAVK